MKNMIFAILALLVSMSASANGSLTTIQCLDSKTQGDLQIFLQAVNSPNGLNYTWGYMRNGRQDGRLTVDRIDKGTIFLSDHYGSGVPALVLVPTPQPGLYNGYVTGVLFGNRQKPVKNYPLACSIQ